MIANNDDNNQNKLLTFLNDAGFAIIPLPERSKGPTLPGWQKRTPADNNPPELVKHLGNFGLVLGTASGEVADIDLDCPEAVIAADYLLPETRWIFGRKTNPRSHRLYRVTDGAGKIQHFNDENGRRVIDYLANGAQCVCPPSLHDETGEQIAFETPIGELGDIGEASCDELLRGVRSIQLVMILANNYKKDNRQDIIRALTGTLLQSRRFSEDDIRDLVRVLCLITKDEEWQKRLKDGVDRTIARKAANKPFTQGKELRELIGEKAFKKIGAFLPRERTASADPSPTMRGDFKRQFENSDEELAKSFKEHANGRVIYVRETDSFYHYSDGIWTPDPKGLGTRREFSVFLKARIDVANQEDWDIRDVKNLLKYKNHQHAMNVVKDFRSFAQTVSFSQLDNHDHALPVKNGLFSFASNRLEPYRPDHYITKRSDIVYEASAECPKFKRFLQDIFLANEDDEELLAYMKTIMGYWITGETDRQECYILQGDGKNGKSTLVNILEGVMGSLFGTVMADTLFDNQKSMTALSDLANLQGKRLVVAAEAESGDARVRLNEQRIKVLAGDDLITARQLYKEAVTFRSKCKTLLMCNEAPVIKANDDGITRKIKKIPFDYTVPEDQRVFGLHKQLLDEEGPGILNYLLEGVQDYLRRRNNIRTPKAVVVATENYIAGQNIVKQYLESGLVHKVPGGRTPKAVFYEAFIQFCNDELIEPVGKKHFGQAMLKLKYKDGSNGQDRFWKGLVMAGDHRAQRHCEEEDEAEKVLNLAHWMTRS